MKMVYGRRVRQARRIRRYTVSFVAGEMGIRQPRLSELEGSYVGEVTGEMFARLAKALDFPEHFFSVEPKEPFHRGSLLFRARSSLTDTDAEHLAEYAAAAGEVFSGLVERASCPPLRLPDFQKYTDPAEAARVVRAQFGLEHEEPVGHLIRRAERAGVVVVQLDFDVQLHERLDAFSCWIGDYTERPLVVVRSGASWERCRWSVAHELGHAVMHRKQRDRDMEPEANWFANELIIPSFALKREWPASATLTSLLPLKEKWGISLQALIQHGFHRGLIDDDKRISLYKQLSNRKWPDGTRWREREPACNARDVEAPRLLGKMLEVGFGADVRMDSISDSVGHWPVLLLQQLLGPQLKRADLGQFPRSPGQIRSFPDAPSNRAPVIRLDSRRTREVEGYG